MLDFNTVPTPCYVVDEGLLENNLKLLHSVEERTGCRILLALKGFAMYSLFGLVGKYLSGVTASGLHEARLGFEEMGREVHVFSPAYGERELAELLSYADHIVFNSFSQWEKYRDALQRCERRISCGIRVNPGYSEIETDIYNPCFPGSRLGVTPENFRPELLDGISGLHFHTMCEQGAETLARTVEVVCEKFGDVLSKMEWVNFGGGHHITKPGYNVELLAETIVKVRDRYGVQVYLEPGEAVALNCGFLVGSVLDFVQNGDVCNAILDVSAACHMPDVLEMPYRPEIVGAGLPREKAHTYRLGGATCLAGDVIGDYSFDRPLSAGDKLVFCDMAHYSMVKNNTFNGMPLPSIARYNDRDGLQIVKQFGYEDFKMRL